MKLTQLLTATAVMALHLARKQPEVSAESAGRYDALVENGLRWLSQHQNSDGGWGDTILSVSNISTTMLANAVFHATEAVASNHAIVDAS